MGTNESQMGTYDEIAGGAEIFKPHTTDYQRSPYTGLTRESWLEAGEYMLEGVFRHIDSPDAPVVVPRREKKVTYPHLDASEEQQARERKAEIFEGLTRTFFIGSVMIANEPDLTIHGILLRDYYKEQILRVVNPEDAWYVGSYEQMQELSQAEGQNDPFHTYQQTVETCALVIGLWACREQIWDTYTKEEKDSIAAFLTDWSKAPTVPQNWRLFNMLDMAFLSMNGYPIDERIMGEHTQAILNYTVGDGWYRDGKSFDYYSCWAFNFYAPLWCVWYGYEHMPAAAAKFEQYSNELMKTYADMFDGDGWTNMWGRSCIYRNAATSAFDGNFFLHHPTCNPGRARRIASGSLLQFLQHPDFRDNGVPTLGFYGQFTPLVQGYSCAESVFWLGKAFLCLHLPADHPFWTAKEENGFFGDVDGKGHSAVQETVLDGPALCFTNHRANGGTILRTGKVNKMESDVHGMWNYEKLSYNTKYPWESTPFEDGTKLREDVEAQQYVLNDPKEGYLRGNTTFWCGARDGVLYRRQFFHWRMEQEYHWISGINLADFPVPYGLMRVDKTRLIYRPAELTLGSYGFPDNGTMIEVRQSPYTRVCGAGDGGILLQQADQRVAAESPETQAAAGPAHALAQAVIFKGKDRRGQAKQMAMTIYDGWDSIEIIRSQGTNPDSANSLIAYAKMAYQHHYDASEPYVLISQVITKESDEDFTEEELFPIASIAYEDPYMTGAYGDVTLTLKDGTVRKVNYEGMEAHLTL